MRDREACSTLRGAVAWSKCQNVRIQIKIEIKSSGERFAREPRECPAPLIDGLIRTYR
jgi:hypothetical protein